MKCTQNKKKYIAPTNCHKRIQFTSLERETLKVFLHARPTGMGQLVALGELSRNVNTTGTGSMRFVC
jgi:hypothetical protein